MRFYRRHQGINFRSFDEPVGDLVENGEVLLFEPEDEIRQQDVGQPAERVDLVAGDQFTVLDLPEGNIMLEGTEVVLVFNDGVIIVVREEHAEHGRMGDEVVVAVEQLAVSLAVIEVIVVEAGPVVVIESADPVADRLFNAERGIERDVAAFAVSADDQIAVKLRRNVLEVLHGEGIGLHPVVQKEVEILVPARDGIVRTAENDDCRSVRQQERCRAEL